MSPSPTRFAAWLAVATLCGGCSYVHDTFSQTVDPGTSDRIHAAVPIGTTMTAAEARLSSLGFNCGDRTGNYTDETGHGRSAGDFLSCVKRPSQLSFACENRDQVVVVPNAGVVDEVDVVRGPDCDQTPGPRLTPPNAGNNNY
jgi:hypothetical protein